MASDFDSLTDKQHHVLGCIAMNLDGGHHPRTLEALERRGLIVSYEDEIRGRGNSPIDRMPMKIKRYTMTLAVHIAWCQWRSEQLQEKERAAE